MTTSIKKTVNSTMKDTISFYLKNLNQSVFIYNCDISLDTLIHAYDFNLIPIIVSNSYDNVISCFNNQNIVILGVDSTCPENINANNVNVLNIKNPDVYDIVKQCDKKGTVFICQNNEILDQLLSELSHQRLIYFDSLSSRKEILSKLDEQNTLEGDFNDCCNKNLVLLTCHESIYSSIDCTDGRITFNALNDYLDENIMEKSLEEAIRYYQTEKFPIKFSCDDEPDKYIDCSNSIAKELAMKNLFMETLLFMQSCLKYNTVNLKGLIENLGKFVSNEDKPPEESNLSKFVIKHMNSNQFKYFDIDKSNKEYSISTFNKKLLCFVLENTTFIKISERATFNKSRCEELYGLMNNRKFDPEEIYMFDNIYRLNRAISFCKYIYSFPKFYKIPLYIENFLKNIINSNYFVNKVEYDIFFDILEYKEIVELSENQLKTALSFFEETYDIIQPTAQAISILKLIIKYNALDLNIDSIKQIISDMKQTHFYKFFKTPKCCNYIATKINWKNYCKIRDYI